MLRPSQLLPNRVFINRARGLMKKLTGLVLLCCLVFSPLSIAQNDADRNSGGKEISPVQAAQIAQDRYGGRVLKVVRDGNVYRIRLLIEPYTVKNVTVSAVSNE